MYVSLYFYGLLPQQYFNTSPDGASSHSTPVATASNNSARIMHKIREIGYVGRYEVAVDHKAMEDDGQRP